jgi:alkylresorcinol/alkylpyrone synthase
VSVRILATGTALPRHYASQGEILARLRTVWSRDHFNPERLAQLLAHSQVAGRYLALPIDAYQPLDSFQKRNDAWLRVGTELGVQAVQAALARARMQASEIDHLFFVSVTGIGTPNIDARLMNRVGFRPNTKRTPIFGLGCVAGAAGIARATDTLRGAPGQAALLLSVELCSLTIQAQDTSVANVIASGLFGDGAAAVVLREGGDEGPRVIDTEAVFYPNTERVMGWDVIDTGFKIVLSPKVPEIAREHVAADVDRLLARNGLRRRDVAHWLAHTGGPRVLDAFGAALGLDPPALARSWASLQRTGNLSSASVLFVLDAFLQEGVGAPGDRGVLLAMGPGFCSEMALLEW